MASCVPRTTSNHACTVPRLQRGYRSGLHATIPHGTFPLFAILTGAATTNYTQLRWSKGKSPVFDSASVMTLCERLQQWWYGYTSLDDEVILAPMLATATPNAPALATVGSDAPAPTSGALTPSQVRDIVKAEEDKERQKRNARFERFYCEQVVPCLRDPTHYRDSKSLHIEIVLKNVPFSTDWLRNRLIADNPNWNVHVKQCRSVISDNSHSMYVRLDEKQ